MALGVSPVSAAILDRKTVPSSFDHTYGEAVTLRDQLLNDMGVKFFREPRVIVVAYDHCLATILTGRCNNLRD